jgi:hypothetical protein
MMGYGTVYGITVQLMQTISTYYGAINFTKPNLKLSGSVILVWDFINPVVSVRVNA